MIHIFCEAFFCGFINYSSCNATAKKFLFLLHSRQVSICMRSLKLQIVCNFNASVRNSFKSYMLPMECIFSPLYEFFNYFFPQYQSYRSLGKKRTNMLSNLSKKSSAMEAVLKLRCHISRKLFLHNFNRFKNN